MLPIEKVIIFVKMLKSHQHKRNYLMPWNELECDPMISKAFLFKKDLYDQFF